MAWRNQGVTGPNNVPLGNRRRFGGRDGDSTPVDDYNPNQSANGYADGGHKRGRSPTIKGILCSTHSIYGSFNDIAAEPLADGERRRKKRNRWGDAAENKAAGLMGL